jgi:hypothetical protein
MPVVASLLTEHVAGVDAVGAGVVRSPIGQREETALVPWTRLFTSAVGAPPLPVAEVNRHRPVRNAREVPVGADADAVRTLQAAVLHRRAKALPGPTAQARRQRTPGPKVVAVPRRVAVGAAGVLAVAHRARPHLEVLQPELKHLETIPFASPGRP